MKRDRKDRYGRVDVSYLGRFMCDLICDLQISKGNYYKLQFL